MTRRQFILIGVAFAAIALLMVVSSWVQYRSQPDTTRWGQTTAVVTGHRTINLNRGTATVVHARYTVEGVVHEADVLTVRDVWSDGRFVAPADTPAVGDVVAVQVDPGDPRAIVPAGRPRDPMMGAWTIALVAALALLAVVCWIVPARR